MSGSEMSMDERAAAASVAGDPAFAALDASGAPIVAAAGDPLRAVYANASARAVFGDGLAELDERLFHDEQPGARRLADLVESVRTGAAPRLERLRFYFGGVPRMVTILCRRLGGEGSPATFVIAALGVRPAPPAQSPQQPGEAGLLLVSKAPPGTLAEPPPPAPDETAGAADRDGALRERLQARHGAGAPRFLWKTDAAGRFTGVTHVLADVVGETSADLLGREAAGVSRALDLGADFSGALASRKSWSGIEVEWPLERAGERVPATLGGLPVFDAERRFSGFQGYGVLHLSRALVRPAALETAGEETPMDESVQPPPEFAAANVVPLRPSTGQPTNGKDGESAARTPAQADGDAVLTPAEGAAFDEIARALGAGGLPQLHGPARELMQRVGHAVAAESPPGGSGEAPLSRHAGALLDLLPAGVLVARGDALLYANRTLLDYLGYADLPSLSADGGLARMFFGQPRDIGASAASGAIEVRARDGETLEADAHLQSVEWDGGPAALVTLRRNRARPRAETRPPPGEEAGQLRAALDASSEAIAILSGDGRVLCVNAAFARLTGAGKAALAGQDLTSLFAPQDALALAECIAHAKAGADDGALRLSVKTPRGGPTPVEAAILRLGAAPGSWLCVTLRDPAPARRTRDELEAARAEAERASAAKSEFLARVSHEIRTPLNAILGFAEVMMEERFGPIGPERYKEYLKDVHASGTLVLSIVNDLLDLSKIEAGKMQLDFARVDANAVITECVSIMQPQANQERVIMRLALAPRLPSLRADERSLKQILLNLLSNAVKFNEPGGQVIVSTALTDAGYVVIRVKDTGIGMNESEIATALEPFGQVAISRQTSGTGLGLPVTKALIEANHASFTIKSRKNEGTLIEVAFPPPQVLAAE